MPVPQDVSRRKGAQERPFSPLPSPALAGGNPEERGNLVRPEGVGRRRLSNDFLGPFAAADQEQDRHPNG